MVGIDTKGNDEKIKAEIVREQLYSPHMVWLMFVRKGIL
jgi:hypothetical protein